MEVLTSIPSTFFLYTNGSGEHGSTPTGVRTKPGREMAFVPKSAKKYKMDDTYCQVLSTLSFSVSTF